MMVDARAYQQSQMGPARLRATTGMMTTSSWSSLTEFARVSKLFQIVDLHAGIKTLTGLAVLASRLPSPVIMMLVYMGGAVARR